MSLMLINPRKRGGHRKTRSAAQKAATTLLAWRACITAARLPVALTMSVVAVTPSAAAWVTSAAWWSMA